MYVVRAHYTVSGNTVLDCSQAEVLGLAFAKQYATEEEAREVAEELQDSVEDVGLDPTTTYTVEEC